MVIKHFRHPVWYLLMAAAVMTLTAWNYARLQRSELGFVDDKAFIFFLVAAGWVLSLGVLYIRLRMGAVVSALEIHDSDRPRTPEESASEVEVGLIASWRREARTLTALEHRVFRFNAMLAAGVVYGLIFASFPYFLEFWPGQRGINFSLSLFLFATNFISGSALFCLVVVLRETWHWANRMDVSIFDRNAPRNRVYSDFLRNVAVITASHSLLAFLAVMSSSIATFWVVLFSGYAILVSIGAYFIPQLPLRRKLQAAKDDAIAKLAVAKADLFDISLSVEQLERWDRLEIMETQVRKIHPRIGDRSARAVKISALTAGLIPIVLQSAEPMLALALKYLPAGSVLADMMHFLRSLVE
jgi:hypothetical protein